MKDKISFDFEPLQALDGRPELTWPGKKPFKSSEYYPAQLKEKYGKDKNGWINKLFWGDNIQVMSHLLLEYRGKIDLIYIDPPFNSKADYKKKINTSTKQGDTFGFREKQYSDIWADGDYLQFMYERLILLKELLSDTGSIYLHCDYRKSSHLRILMDEVFGAENFLNEIIWSYKSGGVSTQYFARKHDNILFYAKSPNYKFLIQKEKSYNRGMKPYRFKGIQEFKDETGWHTFVNMKDVWQLDMLGRSSRERSGYPTQKPEALLERIIRASTTAGDLVFDCFMGSGTTLAVAMKLGRRFLGADINLGALHTTTKRLLDLAGAETPDNYTGFEVYNINSYGIFRNQLEARELLIKALGIQAAQGSGKWDGELDGRMVKIMPIDRMAGKADLDTVKAGISNTDKEKITIICMGHEPDFKTALEKALAPRKFDIKILDILKEKNKLQFKQDSIADIVKVGQSLLIRSFYPCNLMQKLDLQKESLEDWRVLVESILIDWNFDGNVMQPQLIEISRDKSLVKGEYKIPSDAGIIKIKITDLLSESLEMLL